MPRKFAESIERCDAAGEVVEWIAPETAQALLDTGEYRAGGSRGTVTAISEKAPPDGREVADEYAMRARQSRKTVFTEQSERTGGRWFQLKTQRRPWALTGLR